MMVVGYEVVSLLLPENGLAGRVDLGNLMCLNGTDLRRIKVWYEGLVLNLARMFHMTVVSCNHG